MLDRCGACLLCLSLFATAAAAADNWPQFRGPGALGIADGSDLPDEWSATENVRWKKDIPGQGWSSPVVWDDRIFLTSVMADGEPEAPQRGLYLGGERPQPPSTTHHWMVYCLDLASGEVVWEREAHVGTPPAPKHQKNSFSSATPATDGERLVVYFGNVGLFCFDLDGKPLWSKELPVVPIRAGWGDGASPVIDGERVYVINDNEQQSYLLALDKRTGEEIWRVPRDDKSNWATPFVWHNDLRTEIIASGTGNIASYDLDGNLLWKLGNMSDTGIPTPFAADGLLHIASGQFIGQRKPLAAVRPGASGDISLRGSAKSSEHVAWLRTTGAAYNPSPVLYEGLLYVVLDGGFFTCYDAETGKIVYGKKRLPDGRSFTASPFAYNGRVFCLNEYGKTFVIKAGPEYELLGVNPLDDDAMCLASPAIAGDKLLIRTATSLYCLEKGHHLAAGAGTTGGS